MRWPAWKRLRRSCGPVVCSLGIGCAAGPAHVAAPVNPLVATAPAAAAPRSSEPASATPATVSSDRRRAGDDARVSDLPPCRPASASHSRANDAAPGDAVRGDSVRLAAAQVPPAPAQPGATWTPEVPGSRATPAPPEMPAEPPVVSARPEVPIDFGSALSFAAGQNPRVAFANERIREALAALQAAEILWLPTINAGANYNKHEGRIQNVEGEIIETSRGAAFGGLGAHALGAGSPAVAGLAARFQVTDAVFQPRIAEAQAAARQFSASATLNDMLLDVSLAYLALLEAHQRHSIAEDTLANARELADLTAAFAETGQGNQADADRARTELSIRQNDVLRAVEAIEVASARLAQLLSRSPAARFVPLEPAITPVELVAPATPLPELLATGLAHRPELAENSLLVAEAIARLEREQNAVWLPSVLLGMSYGTFGGGLGSEMSSFSDRWDFDAAVWWQVRNLGVGEKAARDQARSRISQARWRQVQAMDQVANEIASAHAQVEARSAQIETARRAIEAAIDSYQRNRARIREGEGLPLEVLQSLQALDQARREYLRAIAEYNEAQFRLYRALGCPIAGGL